MSRKSSTSSASSDDTRQPPAYSGHQEPTEVFQPSSLLDKQVKDVESSVPAQKIKYPISVFFIVINEFCERFSYYGMRTVLTLYLRDSLGYDEDFSTVMYHVFVMLCYFTPVFGAILADTYLGKFTTIFSLSILYAIGEIILAVSAIPDTLPQEAFSLVGLFIIAVGTGGIKPCVSAFGGDQFIRPQQDRQLETFFSIFYFAINAGSLISTFITPILREDVKCFEQNTCFPLAFGVPAILMIIAVIIFIVGKPLYKIRKPEGNIMLSVAKCIGHAIKRKWKSKEKKHDHWLDYASDKYDKQLISDVKRVLSVLVLYLPVPIFWALFDQQGSRWTFQATRMRGDFGEGGWSLKADQMQIVNPLLILILVPIFESLIYPCFSKCNLLTPLQRMATGGIIAGIAFVISGVVELQLEPTYPKIPGAGLTQIDFFNTLPCTVKIHGNFPNATPFTEITIDPTSRFKFGEEPDYIPAGSYHIHAMFEGGACGDLPVTGVEWMQNFETMSEKSNGVVISIRNEQLELFVMKEELPLEKSSDGPPRVMLIFNTNGGVDENDIKFTNITLRGPQNYSILTNITTPEDPMSGAGVVQIMAMEVEVGKYDVLVPKNEGASNEIEADQVAATEMKFDIGGTYVVIIQRSLTGTEEVKAWNFLVTTPNEVHMLWLIPQFFVMTIGEVLMSVTGLQFSFTQAPARMRSVMQAMWQLTVAFGNLIVIIVAEAKGLPKQSDEFFLFAGLMGLDMIIFIFLATRYEYVSVVEDEQKKPIDDGSSSSGSSSSSDTSQKKGKDNQGFSDTGM